MKVTKNTIIVPYIRVLIPTPHIFISTYLTTALLLDLNYLGIFALKISSNICLISIYIMMDCKKEREIAKSRCVEYYHKMYNVNIFWKLRQNTWSFTYFKWCLLLLLQLLAMVFRLAFFKGWLTWLMHDIRSISKQQCRRTWFLVGNSRLGPWFVNQVVSNSWLGFIMRTAHTHFYVLCQSDTSTF